MKLLIFLLFSSSIAFAQPRLDPNKFTVCSMTINSSNEKRVFEEQMAKDRNRFNPMVELTTLGNGDNWFEAACRSGIRCDQLLISGHFSSSWSGRSGKKLPLQKMEEMGCSDSCKGILNHPYEVFLMGCNTMATKKKDHRTATSYRDHLLHDGMDQYSAEMTSEARYGLSGDDNRTRFQRTFRGGFKRLYGFDSVGPSGTNVEGLLRNYFSRVNLAENLERVRAARLMGNVEALNAGGRESHNSPGFNRELAEALAITAFDQCAAGADNERDRRICRILDPRVNVNQKLDTILQSLQSENWIKYMPVINEFFKKHPVSSMNARQKETVRMLSQNAVLKRQVKGMVEKSEFLSVQIEWSKFARNFGYLTPQEEANALGKTLNRMLESGLTKKEADLICFNRDILPRRSASASSPVAQGPNTTRGVNCLVRERLTIDNLLEGL